MSEPSREEVAARLAAVVGHVARRVRPAHGELSAGHFSTLATIARFGPQRPSDLARHERVSAPTMTRIVSALEARGLASRRQAPDDARSVLIELTPEGARLLSHARTERTTAVERLLDVLDDDGIATVVVALGALEAVAHKAVGVGPADVAGDSLVGRTAAR
jgi:DNA-binding MarR family transcriptional regulator